MFSVYAELIRIRFLMMMAYRVNYYSGILIYSINIGAYYFLWAAIYGGKTSLGGLTVVQMTSYIAVAWMARAFYFNNIDREIAQEIKDGTVAIQLIRPYNYLVVKLMQSLGEGIFRLVMFSIPGMVIVYLLFPVELPADLQLWLTFLCSLLLSFIINTQINIITGIMAFYLLNNEGLIRAKRVIVDLFSGLLLPISFFPLWAKDLMAFLLFQAISYLPSMIISRGIKGVEIWQAIGQQAIWIFVLALPIQLLWLNARKQLVVQGG